MRACAYVCLCVYVRVSVRMYVYRSAIEPQQQVVCVRACVSTRTYVFSFVCYLLFFLYLFIYYVFIIYLFFFASRVTTCRGMTVFQLSRHMWRRGTKSDVFRWIQPASLRPILPPSFLLFILINYCFIFHFLYS